MAGIRLGWVIVLLVAGVAMAAEPPASQTSEYAGHGKWRDLPEPQAITTVSDPTLDRVEDLIDAHRTDDAHDLISDWLKSHGKSPPRDRALYLLALVDVQEDERITAFYQLDELLDTYPESRFFGPALQKQYDIADAFLRGRKRKLLGLYLLSAEEEAIEMLYRVQERSPGSAIAERALLRTADYYFRSSQFDLAGDAYGSFARAYPRSPDVPYVKLRQAFSSLAQFRGVQYDSTPLIDARAQFEEVISRYPDLAAEENVAERVQRIDDTLAHKLLVTADFYRRTSEPRAAVYTYRYMLLAYPGSPYTGQATRALASFPRRYLQEPAPVAPRGGSAPFAATAPSAPETEQKLPR